MQAASRPLAPPIAEGVDRFGYTRFLCSARATPATDCLIIGGGAVGMIVADQLLAATDATRTRGERHHQLLRRS